jgi:DNA-binding MarR family transcriptional regulator
MVAKQANSPARTDYAHDMSDLDDLIGYNLKRAYMVVQADFREALGQDGLSPRVFSALSLTVQMPNITQSSLARELGIERSGLVAIVDELESRQYLVRTAVPGDRRVQALVPTDAGRKAYADAVATVRAHETRLLSSLTQGERDSLLRMLQKIRRIEAE